MDARSLHATELFDESRNQQDKEQQLTLLAYLTLLRDSPRLEAGDGFKAVPLSEIHKAAHGIEFSIGDNEIVSVIVAFADQNIVLISVYAGTARNIPMADHERM